MTFKLEEKVDKTILNDEIKSDEFYREYAKKYMLKTFAKKLDIPIYFDRQNVSKDYFVSFGSFIDYNINKSDETGCVIIIYIKNIIEKDAKKLYYQKPIKSYHDCIISIIEHELAHFHLFDEGLPYTDYDLEFIDICFQHKIVLNQDDIHTKRFYNYKFKDKGNYLLNLWKNSIQNNNNI